MGVIFFLVKYMYYINTLYFVIHGWRARLSIWDFLFKDQLIIQERNI